MAIRGYLRRDSLSLQFNCLYTRETRQLVLLLMPTTLTGEVPYYYRMPIRNSGIIYCCVSYSECVWKSKIFPYLFNFWYLLPFPQPLRQRALRAFNAFNVAGVHRRPTSPKRPPKKTFYFEKVITLVGKRKQMNADSLNLKLTLINNNKQT